MRSMLLFTIPMILGNLLQQCYNVADTLIVGRFLGKNALAAVGSSFSLMTFLTCVQQSVMNLGILMVQGLVNSFGSTVMAAFAAAVKIDAFAYMPLQDFGNAFSTFIAQNYGAKQTERIRAGLKGALLASMSFSIAVSGLVWMPARFSSTPFAISSVSAAKTWMPPSALPAATPQM